MQSWRSLEITPMGAVNPSTFNKTDVPILFHTTHKSDGTFFITAQALLQQERKGKGKSKRKDWRLAQLSSPDFPSDLNYDSIKPNNWIDKVTESWSGEKPIKLWDQNITRNELDPDVWVVREILTMNSNNSRKSLMKRMTKNVMSPLFVEDGPSKGKLVLSKKDEDMVVKDARFLDTFEGRIANIHFEGLLNSVRTFQNDDDVWSDSSNKIKIKNEYGEEHDVTDTWLNRLWTYSEENRLAGKAYKGSQSHQNYRYRNIDVTNPDSDIFEFVALDYNDFYNKEKDHVEAFAEEKEHSTLENIQLVAYSPIVNQPTHLLNINTQKWNSGYYKNGKWIDRFEASEEDVKLVPEIGLLRGRESKKGGEWDSDEALWTWPSNSPLLPITGDWGYIRPGIDALDKGKNNSGWNYTIEHDGDEWYELRGYRWLRNDKSPDKNRFISKINSIVDLNGVSPWSDELNELTANRLDKELEYVPTRVRAIANMGDGGGYTKNGVDSWRNSVDLEWSVFYSDQNGNDKKLFFGSEKAAKSYSEKLLTGSLDEPPPEAVEINWIDREDIDERSFLVIQKNGDSYSSIVADDVESLPDREEYNVGGVKLSPDLSPNASRIFEIRGEDTKDMLEASLSENQLNLESIYQKGESILDTGEVIRMYGSPNLGKQYNHPENWVGVIGSGIVVDNQDIFEDGQFSEWPFELPGGFEKESYQIESNTSGLFNWLRNQLDQVTKPMADYSEPDYENSNRYWIERTLNAVEEQILGFENFTSKLTLNGDDLARLSERGLYSANGEDIPQDVLDFIESKGIGNQFTDLNGWETEYKKGREWLGDDLPSDRGLDLLMEGLFDRKDDDDSETKRLEAEVRNIFYEGISTEEVKNWLKDWVLDSKKTGNKLTLKQFDDKYKEWKMVAQSNPLDFDEDINGGWTKKRLLGDDTKYDTSEFNSDEVLISGGTWGNVAGRTPDKTWDGKGRVGIMGFAKREGNSFRRLGGPTLRMAFGGDRDKLIDHMGKGWSDTENFGKKAEDRYVRKYQGKLYQSNEWDNLIFWKTKEAARIMAKKNRENGFLVRTIEVKPKIWPKEKRVTRYVNLVRPASSLFDSEQSKNSAWGDLTAAKTKKYGILATPHDRMVYKKGNINKKIPKRVNGKNPEYRHTYYRRRNK